MPRRQQSSCSIGKARGSRTSLQRCPAGLPAGCVGWSRSWSARVFCRRVRCGRPLHDLCHITGNRRRDGLLDRMVHRLAAPGRSLMNANPAASASLVPATAWRMGRACEVAIPSASYGGWRGDIRCGFPRAVRPGARGRARIPAHTARPQGQCGICCAGRAALGHPWRRHQTNSSAAMNACGMSCGLRVTSTARRGVAARLCFLPVFQTCALLPPILPGPAAAHPLLCGSELNSSVFLFISKELHR